MGGAKYQQKQRQLALYYREKMVLMLVEIKEQEYFKWDRHRRP